MAPSPAGIRLRSACSDIPPMKQWGKVLTSSYPPTGHQRCMTLCAGSAGVKRSNTTKTVRLRKGRQSGAGFAQHLSDQIGGRGRSSAHPRSPAISPRSRRNRAGAPANRSRSASAFSKTSPGPDPGLGPEGRSGAGEPKLRSHRGILARGNDRATSAVEFQLQRGPRTLPVRKCARRGADDNTRNFDFALPVHKNGRIVTPLMDGDMVRKPVRRYFFVWPRHDREAGWRRKTLRESEQLARGVIDTALDAFIQMDEKRRPSRSGIPRRRGYFGWVAHRSAWEKTSAN